MFDRLHKMAKGVVQGELPAEPVVVYLADRRFGYFTVTGHWNPRS